MRWKVIALIASFPLLAVQVAHTQDTRPQPSCDVACRVNPFTAPASCACGTAGGETPAPASEAPAPPAVPVEPPTPPPPQAPAAPGVPSCEVACRVNPFTAPASCACGAAGGGATAPAPVTPAPPAASVQPPAVAAAPAASAGAGVPGLRSWAGQPGETIRNSFGPAASDCRGACGPGCQSAQSCESGARYECLGGDRLLRIETYACGTHQGCRLHDDCLDRCAQANAQGVDCEATCHIEVVRDYPVENAMAWLQGGGPQDAERIFFEYTRSAPGMAEPVYRCAEGARLECGGAAARCLTAANVEVAPVFDAFPAAGPGTVSVSGFRSGRLCEQAPGGSGVCEPAVDIQVTGADSCAQGAGSARCTRFGFEFDYQGANPAVPLMCTASSRGGTPDLPSFLVAQGLSAVASQEDSSDLGAAVRGLQDALQSGRSLEDVFSGVSVAPLDENGNPVESARVGASPAPATAPPTPSRVSFEAARGRLVVPMYELHSPARSGQIVEREVTCTYNGAPVIESRFRLHY